MTQEHQEQNQPKGPDEADTATRQDEGEQSEAPAPKGAAPKGAAPKGAAPKGAAPKGAAPASDLFDLMGASGEQFKKPEPKEKDRKKAAGQAKDTAQKKYPSGMEIHHAGHKLALPGEMTEAEVFTFLADDFPEVTADRAEIREDKHKGRLVVAFRSFKKGQRGG